MKQHPLAYLLALTSAAAFGAEEQSTSWEHAPSDYVVPPGMVHGGAFIDRILPMPVANGLRSDVWGGDNVKPRNVENGLEDPKWSYWCMDVFHAEGKEHMFAVRWLESSPKGHMNWGNSTIVHAVAEQPTGPFQVQQEIGPGHNVMCYQAQDGTYVLYAIGRAYTSRSLDGPWQPYDLKYDTRGTAGVAMSNHTFTQREDGSYLMISRSGHVWISEDGLKPYQKITTESAYPPVKGRYEDPVVWRDEVQYHLIVNDWFGRIAYYLRSKDGVSWVWDQGKAYDITMARHPDGTREKWYKFERPNVRQDALGRATHIYFAVIDSGKDQDLGSDNHSSKIIALPLTVQRRLKILNYQPDAAANWETRVAILAEEGFDPTQDVDVASLTFGAPKAVDFGKGGKAVKTEITGKDLVVTFAGENGIEPADYAGKLLGRTRRGELLYGYVRLPGHTAPTAILSPRQPELHGADTLSITVENFGLAASDPATMQVKFRGSDRTTKEGAVVLPAMQPKATAKVAIRIPAGVLKPGTSCDLEIITPCKNSQPLVTKTKLAVPATP